jgi:hypothetical protein
MLTRLRWTIASWISPELDKASDDYYKWWELSVKTEQQLEGEVYSLEHKVSELLELVADQQEQIRDLQQVQLDSTWGQV